MDTEHKLNCKWNIWIHKTNDKSWSLDSYNKIYTFDTIEGFWKFYKSIQNINDFMFFMMRDGVNPVWEDKHNINGGSFSYIVPKDKAYNSWIHLSMKMIGEIISDKNGITQINGISISPRFTAHILKIWNKDSCVLPRINLNDEKHYKKFRYKCHKN